MVDKRVSSDQPGGISSDVIDKPRWHFGDFMYGLYIYFRVGTTSAPQTYLYVDYTNSLVQKKILKSMILATELQSYDRNKVCRVVCISDTHERHSSIIVPPCDILVHSGDIVFVGRKQSPDLLCSKMKSFDTWLSSTPSALRIVVPGNHDNILESLNEHQRQTLLPSATLLNNTRVNYKGLVLFGSPYSTGHRYKFITPLSYSLGPITMIITLTQSPLLSLFLFLYCWSHRISHLLTRDTILQSQ